MTQEEIKAARKACRERIEKSIEKRLGYRLMPPKERADLVASENAKPQKGCC